MKFRNNIQAGLLCVFIAGSVIVTGSIRKAAVRAHMPGALERVQLKKANGTMIVVEPMRPAANAAGNLETDFYTMRITLRSGRPVKERLMQYMSFDIGNNFCAVQGTDTLSCLGFERVPGIARNEFLYVASFNKIAADTGDNLRVCITDTVAGFGPAILEIKAPLLKSLEPIKY